MITLQNMTNVSVSTSSQNITSDEETITNVPHTSWAIIWILIAICLVTFMSNLTVMASFILEPRLREPFNYFLLNLAICDFITGAFSMTQLTIYTYYTYWPFGYKHCTFWLYIDWLGVNASILTLAVISMDRMWAVVKPASYQQYNTSKKAIIAILLIWAIVNAGILPGQIYDRLHQGDFYGKYDCFWDFRGPTVWASPLYVVPLTEWIPTLIITFCYVMTTVEVYQISKRRQVQVGTNFGEVPVLPSARERRWLKEKQAYILLSLLFIALIICWGPWFVYSGLATYDSYYSWTVYMATYWIGYGMSMINPFLFNIANPEMRQAVRRILRCGNIKSPAVGLPRSTVHQWLSP